MAMRRERDPELLSVVLLTAGLVCWGNRYIILSIPPSSSRTSTYASVQPVVGGEGFMVPECFFKVMDG